MQEFILMIQILIICLVDLTIVGVSLTLLVEGTRYLVIFFIRFFRKILDYLKKNVIFMLIKTQKDDNSPDCSE